jgi:hypothetical protein
VSESTGFFHIQSYFRYDFIRRLSAGHTAIHTACQLGSVAILHLFLTLKKDHTKKDQEDDNEHKQQEQKVEDRHVYQCLRIEDHAKLTPIHWAATQEIVSKRQKIFAYLDQRMPGILDSRYNMNWFHFWAQTHPWVVDEDMQRHSPVP